MQVVILAGGLGTRLSEETVVKPKPMIEIGSRPILWHIMKLYSWYGFHDFIICLGYKGYMIKEYFLNYCYHMSDITVDLTENNVEIHQNSSDPCRVTLVDTGELTMTGGRIKRVMPYIKDHSFMVTYGDGVADINISQLVEFHNTHKKIATVTAVQPPGRFGSLVLGEHQNVKEFVEKPLGDNAWINGGFFVLTRDIFPYLKNNSTVLEKTPLETLAVEGNLMAFTHKGFWHPMDTLRDKNSLENLWNSGNAPWKVWE
jgi:glucose-1-phosphate cytidylyltransferase